MINDVYYISFVNYKKKSLFLLIIIIIDFKQILIKNY